MDTLSRSHASVGPRLALLALLALIAGLAAMAVLTPPAGAASPVLNARTTQIPGTQCSVTGWEYFDTENGTYTMHYGGGTSCAGHVGVRTLNVVPQVFNLVKGQPRWFSISGEGLYQGPTPAGPLRLSRSRTAVASHIYRLLAYAQVILANGTLRSVTTCVSCQGTSPTLSIVPAKGFVYSIPATSTSLPGLPCVVTQQGASFPLINSTTVMNYAGNLSCAPSVTGPRTLTISAQVAGPPHGPRRYYTITGSQLSTSAGARTPFLDLFTGRTVYTGHPYRVVATATVTEHGRTVTASTHSLTTGP